MSHSAHHCDSPGCSRREEPHCDSPGCTRGMGSMTQQPLPPVQNPPSLTSKMEGGYASVLWTVEGDVLVLAIIHYPEVNKFGGMKIAVYTKSEWTKISKSKEIDPHFYEASGPIARFSPTLQGIRYAANMLELNARDNEINLRVIKKLFELHGRKL